MSPESGSPWREQSWRWDIWVAVVTVLTGLVMAWVSEHLPQEELFKRALMRTVAPAMTPLYDDRSQHSITVATIDDLDLQTFDKKWPVPYSFLGNSVQAMLALRPKVLFIDLLLKQQAPEAEMEELRAVICEGRGDTTVYIASIHTELLPDSDMEKLLFEPTVANGQPCAKRVDPQIRADKYDQLQWAYPARIDTAPAPGKVRPQDRSAAFKIFCDLHEKDCTDKEVEPLALIWPTSSFDKNIESMIRFKSPSPSAGPSNASTPAAQTPPNPDDYEPACRDGIPFWEAVPLVTLARGWLQPVAKLPPCPYLRVMPLRALIAHGFSEGEVRHAFGDQIILLGADIVGSGDKVISPVNGTLPGVYAHAMALSNLMVFQGKYKRADGGGLFALISVLSIVAMLTLWRHYFTETEVSLKPVPTLSRQRTFLGRLSVLLFVVPMLAAGWPRGRPTADARRHLLRRVAFICINIALFSVLFWVGYVWLREGPLSMIEYLIFPFVAHFVHAGKTVAERSRDWWRALWADNPWSEWAQRRAASDPHAP